MVALSFAVTVWGASFVAARPLLKTLDPLTLAAARFAIASLFFAGPFAIALGRGAISGRDLLKTAFLVLFRSVAGFFAWSFALSRREASRAAVWICAEPVVAMAPGFTLPGERHGAVAIAVSVLVVTRGPIGDS